MPSPAQPSPVQTQKCAKCGTTTEPFAPYKNALYCVNCLQEVKEEAKRVRELKKQQKEVESKTGDIAKQLEELTAQVDELRNGALLGDRQLLIDYGNRVAAVKADIDDISGRVTTLTNIITDVQLEMDGKQGFKVPADVVLAIREIMDSNKKRYAHSSLKLALETLTKFAGIE